MLIVFLMISYLVVSIARRESWHLQLFLQLRRFINVTIFINEHTIDSISLVTEKWMPAEWQNDKDISHLN